MSVITEPGRGAGIGPVVTGAAGATTLPFTSGNETLTIVALVAIAVGATALLSRAAVLLSRFLVR